MNNTVDVGKALLQLYTDSQTDYDTDNRIKYWSERIADLENDFNDIKILIDTKEWKVYEQYLDNMAFLVNEQQVSFPPGIETSYKREQSIGKLFGLAMARNVLQTLRNELNDAINQLKNLKGELND